MSRGTPLRLLATALGRGPAEPPPSDYEVEQIIRNRLYGDRPRLVTVISATAESPRQSAQTASE
jgi:hypothetical protein